VFNKVALLKDNTLDPVPKEENRNQVIGHYPDRNPAYVSSGHDRVNADF
jgi:hypothetical protein